MTKKPKIVRIKSNNLIRILTKMSRRVRIRSNSKTLIRTIRKSESLISFILLVLSK